MDRQLRLIGIQGRLSMTRSVGWTAMATSGRRTLATLSSKPLKRAYSAATIPDLFSNRDCISGFSNVAMLVDTRSLSGTRYMCHLYYEHGVLHLLSCALLLSLTPLPTPLASADCSDTSNDVSPRARKYHAPHPLPGKAGAGAWAGRLRFSDLRPAAAAAAGGNDGDAGRSQAACGLSGDAAGGGTSDGAAGASASAAEAVGGATAAGISDGAGAQADPSSAAGGGGGGTDTVQGIDPEVARCDIGHCQNTAPVAIIEDILAFFQNCDCAMTILLKILSILLCNFSQLL